MKRLYYYPGNASFAPHLLLEEAGCEFELVLVDRKRNAQKSADCERLARGRGRALLCCSRARLRPCRRRPPRDDSSEPRRGPGRPARGFGVAAKAHIRCRMLLLTCACTGEPAGESRLAEGR